MVYRSSYGTDFDDCEIMLWEPSPNFLRALLSTSVWSPKECWIGGFGDL